MSKRTSAKKRRKKDAVGIECPRCRAPCDRIMSSDGYLWCVHDYRDSNGKRHIHRHSLGPSSGEYKIYNSRSVKNKADPSKKNIKLRNFRDESRFKKYIEESLKLMKEQENFDINKVIEVLDIFKGWLQELDSKEEYKRFIDEKMNEIKQKLESNLKK